MEILSQQIWGGTEILHLSLALGTVAAAAAAAGLQTTLEREVLHNI